MRRMFRSQGKLGPGSDTQRGIGASRCEQGHDRGRCVLAILLLLIGTAQAGAQQVDRDADVWANAAHQSTRVQVKVEETAAGIRPTRQVSERERAELGKYMQQLLSEPATLRGASKPQSHLSQPNQAIARD